MGQTRQDRADEKTRTQDVIVARQLVFSRTACRGCTCDPHAYPCIHTVAGVIPDRRRRTAWPVVTVLQIGDTRQQAADVLTAIKGTFGAVRRILAWRFALPQRSMLVDPMHAHSRRRIKNQLFWRTN